jgi:FLYWCH zinc finger domain
MAAPNVEWLKSRRLKQQLTVDGYIFRNNGAGKDATQPNVLYWVCATSGCLVRAKTDGDTLISVSGAINQDHGHANNTQEIANMRLTVSFCNEVGRI